MNESDSNNKDKAKDTKLKGQKCPPAMLEANPYDIGKWVLKITNFVPYKDFPELYS